MGKEGKYDLKLADVSVDVDTDDKEEEMDQSSGMICWLLVVHRGVVHTVRNVAH